MGKCEKCGKDISQKVEEYSKTNYGKPLCFDCQKAEKPIEKPKEVEAMEEQPDEINLHGKKFITHSGLLKKAHAAGLFAIKTEMLDSREPGMILFKATVMMETKQTDAEGNPMAKMFTAHGDATDTNVSGEMKQHKLRLAETRAVNRALRLSTGTGSCSAEELGEKVEDEQVPTEESRPVQG